MSHNSLTPAQAERLHLLIEECGEVIQVAAKTLRHGYESYDPTVAISCRETNRQALEYELGHVYAAVMRMTLNQDVDTRRIADSREIKLQRGGRWLHHQPDTKDHDRGYVPSSMIQNPEPPRPELNMTMSILLKPEMAEAMDKGCTLPPTGWICSRPAGHDGPCAAYEIAK